MTQKTVDISSQIREGIIEIIQDDSYFIDELTDTKNNYYQKTRGTNVVVYDEPLELITIRKYPALSVYDFTNIDYSEDQGGIIDNIETFRIDAAHQSTEWRVARDKVREMLNAVRNTLIATYNLSSTNYNNLLDVIDFTFLRMRPVGAFEIKPRLWTYMARLDMTVRYEEQQLPENC